MKTSLTLTRSARSIAAMLALVAFVGMESAVRSSAVDTYIWSTLGNASVYRVPASIAVGPGGELYVAEWYSNTIYRQAADGSTRTAIASISTPTALAVDLQGNLYVMGINDIFKVTPAGVVTALATLWNDPSRIYVYPNGLAVDAAGNVYATDYSNNCIRRIAPDRTVTTVPGTAGQFSFPCGIVLDATGNLYVTDSVAGTISRVATDGTITIVAQADYPTSLAIDGAGNLYVADTDWNYYRPSTSGHTIGKISPVGVVTTIGGSPGSPGHVDGPGAVSRFSVPLGIAVDAAGNVYVGEEGNHAIRKGVPEQMPDGSNEDPADPARWLTKAPTPNELYFARVCELDGLVYLSGVAPSGAQWFGAYDPASDSWQTRATRPTGHFVRSICGVDGQVYATGNVTGTDALFVDIYDPATNSWSTGTATGENYVGQQLCVVDGVIYAVGSHHLATFDPQAGTWTERLPLPAVIESSAFDEIKCCVWNGMIFVYDATGIHVYDPQQDVWETRMMPEGVDPGPILGAVGDLIYSGDSNRIVAYDPLDETFQVVAAGLPTARVAPACAVANKRIFVIGGYDPVDPWAPVGIRANEVFVPDARPPAIVDHPLPQLLTAGGTGTLSVAADTTHLPCTYQWTRNGVAIAGATDATLTLPCAQRFHNGEYSVVITNEFGSTTSAAATITVNAPPPNASRLLNVSTRALCRTGDQILIPGFVIDGTANKRLLLRAVGPTLGMHPFDLDGVLPNPQLALKRWNGAGYDDVAANNNWRDNTNGAALAAATAQVSAFPLLVDRDAALLVDLAPGQYTVFADCADGGSGIAIVELYDADDLSTPTPSAGSGQADARLVNLSNRGFAGVGDELMIPGFVISDEGPKTLLVRVVGPTLAQAPFNVAGAMSDPQLTLYRHEADGTNTLLFTQDNWSENSTSGDAAQTAAIAAHVQAFAVASGSKDAAFVVTLPSGVYTVVGSSADGVSTGIVLVEVYVVE